MPSARAAGKAEELGHSWVIELDNEALGRSFGKAGWKEVTGSFTGYNSLPDSDSRVDAELERYMACANVVGLRSSLAEQTLPEGVSLDASSREDVAKLQWIRRSVNAWAQLCGTHRSMVVHNRLWIPWFDECMTTLPRVSVDRYFGPADVFGRISTKFDCVVKAGNHKLGVAVHCRLDDELDAAYLKVGKAMREILRKNEAPHIVGMVTAGKLIRLLFMAYGGGQCAVLRTKNFRVPTSYGKEALNTLRAILTHLWRLRTFLAGSLSEDESSGPLVGGKLPHDIVPSMQSEAESEAESDTESDTESDSGT